MRLAPEIAGFFRKQPFVIVSTLSEDNSIHCSAKGIVCIQEEGKVYIIDLYQAATFDNLKRNSTISITSVDEHAFRGYTLKGKGLIVEKEKIGSDIIEKWEARLLKRITKRVVGHIQKSKKTSHHPETRFPHPQYLIEMEAEAIIDLTPSNLKSL